MDFTEKLLGNGETTANRAVDDESGGEGNDGGRNSNDGSPRRDAEADAGTATADRSERNQARRGGGVAVPRIEATVGPDDGAPTAVAKSSDGGAAPRTTQQAKAADDAPVPVTDESVGGGSSTNSTSEDTSTTTKHSTTATKDTTTGSDGPERRNDEGECDRNPDARSVAVDGSSAPTAPGIRVAEGRNVTITVGHGVRIAEARGIRVTGNVTAPQDG